MADDGPKRKSRDETPEDAADPAEKVAAAIRSITSNAGKPAAGAPAATVKTDARNPMLDALVYGDNDLIGLVAYAMHELNRRDWCLAYEAANGRLPTEAEVKAYLVGEQLERRLETYRRLSEDALAKLSNTDQPMRRLVEASPQAVTSSAVRHASPPAPQPAPPPPIVPAAAVAPPPPPPAPMPAPRPAPAYEPPMPDESYAPPPRKKNWTRLIIDLALLLGAVVALGYILRSGLIFPISK